VRGGAATCRCYVRRAMRLAIALLVTLTAALASAQDAPPPEAPSEPVEVAPPPDPFADDAAAEVASDETSETTPPPAARTPRVAIVIAGDSDPEMIGAAQAAETALAEDARVAMPSDPALRGALRGEGEPTDGLDEVRAERRRLGLGEARDVLVLATLGERTDADLVLVVRRHHGAIEATGFDVQRRSFYDGEVDLDALDGDALRQFTVRRATRAARPLADGERAPAPEVTEAVTAPAEPPAQQDWFEQNWPFFAAGALLVGAIVFIVFATMDNAEPAPMLRFEAGGGS
jgi:hypothetical protein